MPLAEDQLKLMGVKTLDLALMNIETGELNMASNMCLRMSKEFSSMHDLLVKWIAGIYSHIYLEFGDEVLYAVNYASCQLWIKDLIPLYKDANPEERLKLLCGGFRGHMTGLNVEEDEEKYTVVMQPCGSGGKLVLDGAYDTPTGLARVKRPQPQTLGKSNFPVYCTHCAMQEIIPIEMTGTPLFITDPPEGDEIGNVPCRVYIYKTAGAIPSKFYKRLGKVKRDR